GTWDGGGVITPMANGQGTSASVAAAGNVTLTVGYGSIGSSVFAPISALYWNGTGPHALPSGGANAAALAITASGLVVGYVTAPSDRLHPAVWDSLTHVVDLGVEGIARSVNDAGVVVGALTAAGHA